MARRCASRPRTPRGPRRSAGRSRGPRRTWSSSGAGSPLTSTAGSCWRATGSGQRSLPPPWSRSDGRTSRSSWRRSCSARRRRSSVRASALISPRQTIRYGFAVGKVRVLETRAFGRATYERLLDAPTFAEQKRILSESPYGRYIEGTETPEDVERGLGEALDAFYGFLDESELPKPVVRFFRVRYDFANLKAALKARVVGVPVTSMLVGLGTLPAEEFLGHPTDLPEPFGSLAAGVEFSERDEGGVEGLAGIDMTVDRAMFAELKKCARTSRSEFLEGLARLYVDVANAKTLVRMRLKGASVTELPDVLVDGGSLTAKDVAELYYGSAADLAARLGSLTQLRGINVAEMADPSRLDVVADNVVVAYLRTARAVPVGPEPVIAYVLAREAEVMAVRVLLIGKLSGLDAGVLRARLRDLYE
ncbi:MAG: hypothetical protein C0418_00260 [Coriobacteriaceae bacterium]|nr:hypothetical protein [Coriobacteriaceae bacterium]